ncbi:hypothetical protein GUITHDRAFT_56057, partial [Guillardia theta CCMP2712]
LQAIYSALAATLSPNQKEREAAEALLKNFEGTPGYISSLFRVVNSNEVSIEIKQAGIIYFKNLVRPRAAKEGGGSGYDERNFIRQNILEAIVMADHRCRGVITESLRRIASNDFPEKMPNFLDEVTARLDPAIPPEHILGALYALRVLTKNYEYKAHDKREQPLNEIMSKAFPRLPALMEATLSSHAGDEKTAEMQKVIIKSLWSCVHQSVPLYLQDYGRFVEWMSLLYRVIEAPVPPQAQGGPNADKDELNKLVFWKCKRWSAKILHRLFEKYGSPKVAEKQFGANRAGEVQLSQAFHNELANRFLQLFMQLLAKKADGVFLPESLVVEGLHFIDIAITLAITWKLLKPNCMALISHVLFPMICFDEEDEELWTSDPQEFIRKTYDFLEDYSSQRSVACSLVVNLCKKRTKTTLIPTIEFCISHMKSYAEGGGNARLKDGALYCIGSLAGALQEQKMAAQYEGHVRDMLVKYAIPELKSSKGHLRSRAAWTLSQYVDTILKDPSCFQSVLGEIINMLQDAELPVRFQAAIALRLFIYDMDEGAARTGVLPLLSGFLPQLLDKLFGLIDEVGSDELIASLEILIECFEDEMAPYAQQLCQRLSEHFLRLTSSEGEGEDDAAIAASQCCSAIKTLLDSIKKTPELYHSLEPNLVPLLAKVLSPDSTGDYVYMEFMEEFLEILTYLTYYSPTISEGVWSLFPLLTKSFFDWAFDYLSNINLPLDNYISRSTTVFLSNPEHPLTVYRMIDKVMQHEDSSERDLVEACKLSESLILNCKGAIDSYIPPLLQLSCQRSTLLPSSYCRTELFKMIANCLFYNAEGTLTALEQQGTIVNVFHAWRQEAGGRRQEAGDRRSHFKGLHDQKVCILGLTSILKVPVPNMPPSVSGGLSHILRAILEL